MNDVNFAPQVAVVGSGYWGKNLVRNFHELGALAAVCESREDLRHSLKQNYSDCRLFSSYQELLQDKEISAVAIATPAETHADLVRQAILAGKDVFVEKPLCLSVSIGEQLIALAREQERVLMVGHLLWYHPAILKLKEMIDAGELGRIQYIYSNRLNLGKIRREENILWSFAPHDISVILGLLGEMPEIVTSQGGNYLHQNIADVTVSLLSFPSGVKAHIFVSWLHPFKEQKLVIVGDRQMVVFDDVEPDNKLMVYPHSISWVNQTPIANKAEGKPVAFDFTEPLRNECQHYLECIQTRQRPRTDGAEALRVLSVLRQCEESLSEESLNRSVKSEDNSLVAEAASPGTETPAGVKGYFAHESAFVDDGVEIGEGSSIWHVSHILKGSRIGKNCKIGQNVVIGPKAVVGDGVKIQNNVSVYEGVTLEDYVFCGPSMVFTNVFNPRSEIPRMNELKTTLVKRGATLGANCTIICGTTIGRYALIGAGATVSKDIPDYALAVGVPARVTGWVCSCGHKLRFAQQQGAAEATCSECQKRYERTTDGKVKPKEEQGAEFVD